MVYIVLLALLGLILILTRRRLGIPALIALAVYLVLQLWSTQLAEIITTSGLVFSNKVLAAFIEIIGVALMTGLAIFRSAGTKKSSSRGVIDAFIFSSGLLVFLRRSIQATLTLDYLSLQITAYLDPFSALIMTIFVIFAIHEVLARHN